MQLIGRGTRMLKANEETKDIILRNAGEDSYKCFQAMLRQSHPYTQAEQEPKNYVYCHVFEPDYIFDSHSQMLEEYLGMPLTKVRTYEY